MTAPAVPPLLGDGELDGFTGAPFDERLVEVASEIVRGEVGWHIAPLAETEAQRSGTGGPRLMLPSLRLVEVLEVVEVRTDHPDRVLAGWRRGATGMLIREAGWPRGEDNLRIRMRHGLDRCPADLRPVVVECIRVITKSAVPGTRSTTRTVGEVTTAESVTDSLVARVPAWSIAAAAILDRYRA